MFFFFFVRNRVVLSPQGLNKKVFQLQQLHNSFCLFFFLEQSTADLRKDCDLNSSDSVPDQLFYVLWHWLAHKSESPEAKRGAHASSIYLHS